MNTIIIINENGQIEVSKDFFLIFISVYEQLNFQNTFLLKNEEKVALEWISAIYNTQQTLDPSYSGIHEDNFERWFDRWYKFEI